MFDALVKRVADALVHAGDLALFTLSVLRGIPQLAGRGTYLGIFHAVGYNSLPVAVITGAFIGMVLAVESYYQFEQVGLATRLGSVINLGIVRQLGPVLAAVMLAGRVGSAMAAELATMRITDQVDALSCLGVDPVKHLGTPRLVACVLLIPLLTIVADFAGVIGGWLICTRLFRVESHFYWSNASGMVGMFDIMAGLVKPTVFGIAIAIVSCYRGLNSEPGAEGVGRAATRAFVSSFIAILALNFFLATLFSEIYAYLWPQSKGII